VKGEFMTASTGKTNLLGLTQLEMEKFFDSIGEKRFRAGQVMKWIHHFGVDDFDAMTNVSKALRDKAQGLLPRSVVRKWSARTSPATAPVKWVVRVASGSCVETVYIPQGKRGTSVRFVPGRLCPGLQFLLHRQARLQQQPHRRRSHRSGVDCQQILWQRPGNRRPCHHQRGDDGHGRAAAELRQRRRRHASDDG
jgi:hypothetical protein